MGLGGVDFPLWEEHAGTHVCVRGGSVLVLGFFHVLWAASLQSSSTSTTSPLLGCSLPRDIAIILWVLPKTGSPTNWIHISKLKRAPPPRPKITAYFNSASTLSRVRTSKRCFGRTFLAHTTSPLSVISSVTSFPWGVAS